MTGRFLLCTGEPGGRSARRKRELICPVVEKLFCAGWHSGSRNAQGPALGKQDFELLLSEEMAEFLIEFGGSLKM